eukprot:IDg13995t1
MYPSPPSVSYTRVDLPTADGLDKLAIDITGGSTLEPEDGVPQKPIALVLHGLESNSTGVQSLRLSDALFSAGFKVLAPNYRSCAADAGPPATLRLYHAGFTEDIITVLTAVRTAANNAGKQPAPVYLVGFSLGSNVMCNFLRQAGTDTFNKYSVVAAFGSCVPFDPANCQKTIDYGFRRFLYSSRLVKSMQNKFEAAVRAGVDASAVSADAVRASIRIGDIDECYIAPIFGLMRAVVSRISRYPRFLSIHATTHFLAMRMEMACQRRETLPNRPSPFVHENKIGYKIKKAMLSTPAASDVCTLNNMRCELPSVKRCLHRFARIRAKQRCMHWMAM